MDDSLELKVIRNGDKSSIDMISRTIELSNTIFGTDSNTKYGSLTYWKSQLSLPSAVIIYLSRTNEDRPIGFVFAHPRTHANPLRDGSTESAHVWLAGVLPEFRRRGCLETMMKQFEEEVREHGGQITTICTAPARFPAMWSWLQSRNWVVEREFEHGKIMMSKIEE